MDVPLLGRDPGEGVGDGVGASAVYNVALAQTAQNETHDSVGPLSASISCDKLRLACIPRHKLTRGSILPPVERMMGGGLHYSARPGRNWGEQAVTKHVACLFGKPEDHGVAFVEFHQYGDGVVGRDKLVVEFNPNKVFGDNLQFLTNWFVPRAGWGWSDWWVERHDVAFDYAAPRHVFALDDPSRKLDMFGVGPTGPETERTGYRRGSKLRAQVYDKGAENGTGELLTRFELQVNASVEHHYGKRKVVEWPRLFEIPGLGWPAEGVNLTFFGHGLIPRCLNLEWLLTMHARAYGVRGAMAFARNLLGEKRRKIWRAEMVREVDPAPKDLYRAGWRGAVDRVRQALGEVGVGQWAPVASPEFHPW